MRNLFKDEIPWFIGDSLEFRIFGENFSRTPIWRWFDMETCKFANMIPSTHRKVPYTSTHVTN